jgi:SAM-dependent methyltransferase
MSDSSTLRDVWAAGEQYERYVGRWSRLVAREFVTWLAVPSDRTWLDVGCGTGVLAEAIARQASPASILGVDRSEGFVAHARTRLGDDRMTFQVGDAQVLPVAEDAFDCVVSGLVLNFVPEPRRMVSEMARVARPGSTVALYVWDYAAGMQLIRLFWDVAKALDAGAAALDEAERFPVCAPAALDSLFMEAGLARVETRAIEVATPFRDFDDLWSPFLGGQGPAPTYAMSLSEERRAALREALRGAVPFAGDGTIRLTARAWAIRGRKPDRELARPRPSGAPVSR